MAQWQGTPGGCLGPVSPSAKSKLGSLGPSAPAEVPAKQALAHTGGVTATRRGRGRGRSVCFGRGCDALDCEVSPHAIACTHAAPRDGEPSALGGLPSPLGRGMRVRGRPAVVSFAAAVRHGDGARRLAGRSIVV